MSSNLPVVQTKICPADGSEWPIDEHCVCEGCDEIRRIRESAGRIHAADKKREMRRAKALKLAERQKGKSKCTS